MESLEPVYQGKVRDLYDVDHERMILVSSDRLSAFDVVFPDTVPSKGEILTRVSTLWFRHIRKTLEPQLNFSDHLISDNLSEFPAPFCDQEEFENRAVLVKKTKRIDFECVVRGYLTGSGWKDYQKTGTVCGIALPEGLQQAEKLIEPVFTPATKAEIGDHDENVTYETMVQKLGPDLAGRLKEISIAIFNMASQIMEKQGILLCDTKFEFGLINDQNGSPEIVLIDEVLTPDSSRFWNKDTYRTGISPAGYDKQYVRDYVEELKWDKNPPAPRLSPEVIEKTVSLYREIESRIETALANSAGI